MIVIRTTEGINGTGGVGNGLEGLLAIEGEEMEPVTTTISDIPDQWGGCQSAASAPRTRAGKNAEFSFAMTIPVLP